MITMTFVVLRTLSIGPYSSISSQLFIEYHQVVEYIHIQHGALMQHRCWKGLYSYYLPIIYRIVYIVLYIVTCTRIRTNNSKGIMILTTLYRTLWCISLNLSSWILKGVFATLWSGRYTLSYPRERPQHLSLLGSSEAGLGQGILSTECESFHEAITVFVDVLFCPLA